MMTKGELISGAYAFLKVAGVTTQPTGDELALAIQVCDDLFAQVGVTLDTGYYQPDQYGSSTSGDESGLIAEFAGPAKKILALELYTTFYDADVPPALQRIAAQGMNALEHHIVQMPPTQLPATLPQGSGNDYLEYDSTFFSGNLPPGTLKFNQGDTTALEFDWSTWTLGEDYVASVGYKVSSGIDYVDQGTEDDISSVKLTFVGTGLKTVCATAKSADGGVKTMSVKYYVKSCEV